MTLHEALETTKIHSVVGNIKHKSGLISERPFRNPHHTICGTLPICNIQIKAEKPCYLPFPNENDKSLGAELKRRRLALEWTQQETANHFRVLKDSYQNWEWNKYIPHIRNIKKVVEFLGYNFWDDGSDSLANRCLLYRIEHGLTMSELAEIVEISCRTIERIENMKGHVSFKIINTISEMIS